MQPVTFGQWIKRLRAEQDLTQEKLSERVGCATPTLGAFETSMRRPSREMAERIADVLKVPADQREEFMRLARQPVGRASENELERLAPNKQSAAPPPQPRLPQQGRSQPIPQLIGREAECTALQTLLLDERNRLITIVGAGGMGKTQLALNLTATLAPHFADGAAFVALAAINQVQHLPSTIANSLNLPLQGTVDLQQQINLWLAGRRMLLTLDNFEQLLMDEEAIHWVRQLLRAAPNLTLLVTSRERLRVSGERIFELGGLGLPADALLADQADAVLLFLERAQQTQIDFVIHDENRQAVSRICHLVEGMPLAIELAAAWVNVLTPGEIADEISRSIDFFALAQRDMTARHRSMRAVFDHSWRLLNEAERAVLAKLSLFRGGCTREAAQQVAGATLPILANLIDKSLLRKSQSTPTRYSMHELVRQYAQDQLQAQPEIAASVAETHAAYYHQLVGEAALQIWGAKIADALRTLDLENDNVRTALEHYLTAATGIQASLDLAGSLWRFWEMRGYITEGRTWLERALQRGIEPPAPSRWLALHGAGNLALDQGEYVIARQHYEASLQVLQAQLQSLVDPDTISRTRYRIANSLTNLGGCALAQGDLDEALVFSEEALALHRQLNSKVGQGLTLTNLAKIRLQQQQIDQAAQLGQESLLIYQELGDERGIGWNLSTLGTVARQRGEVARATTLYEEAERLFTKLADQADLVWLHFDLGELAQAQRESEQAETHYQTALTLAQTLRNKKATALLLDRLSMIASEKGEYVHARSWNDQSLALYREIGHEAGVSEALQNRERITAASKSKSPTHQNPTQGVPGQ
ncbi:MAG: tetratricopeptide repeat protein [Caldilineaceae bacterium]